MKVNGDVASCDQRPQSERSNTLASSDENNISSHGVDTNDKDFNYHANRSHHSASLRDDWSQHSTCIKDDIVDEEETRNIEEGDDTSEHDVLVRSISDLRLRMFSSRKKSEIVDESAVTNVGCDSSSDNVINRKKRIRDWSSSLRRSDPRYQILKYFTVVRNEGVTNPKGLIEINRFSHAETNYELGREDGKSGKYNNGRRISQENQNNIDLIDYMIEQDKDNNNNNSIKEERDSEKCLGSFDPTNNEDNVIEGIQPSKNSNKCHVEDDHPHESNRENSPKGEGFDFDKPQLDEQHQQRQPSRSQPLDSSRFQKSLNHESFSSIEYMLKFPSLFAFNRTKAFTVWRPVNDEAIKKMMLGQGVGKGLDIKGKSARKGKLCGYVPFLQIHNNDHKKFVSTLPKNSKMRIYYQSKKQRMKAIMELNSIGKEIKAGHEEDQRVISLFESSELIGDINEEMEESYENALSRYMWDIDDVSVRRIDDYESLGCYGIEIQERLFWEACVIRKDISRPEGSDYEMGRPSRPAFQNMNFASLRVHMKHNGEEITNQLRNATNCSANNSPENKKNNPTQNQTIESEEEEKEEPRRVVLWQYSKTKENGEDEDEESVDPLCPLTLLVAYEEYGCVKPVVSDFDCFLVGTKRVSYNEPIPDDQIGTIKWSIKTIESILANTNENNNTMSWMSRWLDVLKKDVLKEGFTKPPSYGYGDPKTNQIIRGAIRKLHRNGSVRHGAESFNYYFPQEMESKFLVISKDVGNNLPWKYMNIEELQGFLSDRIDEGYTFPINPKWVLCDPGWKYLYDKLISSDKPKVQQSLDVWYPRSSGIREDIESIYERYPNGFVVHQDNIQEKVTSATEDRELAEEELRRHAVFQRAKRKLKIALFFMRLGKGNTSGTLTPLTLTPLTAAIAATMPEEKDKESLSSIAKKNKNKDNEHSLDCQISSNGTDNSMVIEECEVIDVIDHEMEATANDGRAKRITSEDNVNNTKTGAGKSLEKNHTSNDTTLSSDASTKNERSAVGTAITNIHEEVHQQVQATPVTCCCPQFFTLLRRGR